MIKFNKSTALKALPIGLSAAGVGLSAANFITNRRKLEQSNEYQKRQLQAMDKLSNSLNRVSSELQKRDLKSNDTSAVPKRKSPSFRLKFFQKNSSQTGDLALKGATLGGALAGGAIPFLPKKIGGKTTYTNGKDRNGNNVTTETFAPDSNYRHPKFREKYNNADPYLKNALLVVGGVAIGATLGALAGAIMDVTNHISGRKSLNDRLMKDVCVNLKKMGFQEGRHYTRDPKVSTLLKTKVCLVISKSSDEMKLLINTVNDNGLKSITGQITKNLPTMSTVTEKVSDRFNELNITTMTSDNGNATWVASIAEKFIKGGYPVYLVEVG